MPPRTSPSTQKTDQGEDSGGDVYSQVRKSENPGKNLVAVTGMTERCGLENVVDGPVTALAGDRWYMDCGNNIRYIFVESRSCATETHVTSCIHCGSTKKINNNNEELSMWEALC